MDNTHRSYQATAWRSSIALLSLLAWLVIGVVGLVAAQEPLMVEKNLFSPERKAMETKGPEPTGEPPKLPKGAIQLDGVFLHGDVKKAILRVNPSMLKKPVAKGKTDPFVTVSEDEQLGDYRVAKIEPRSITVEQRGSTFVVPLFAPGKVAPPPPKAPSGAAGQPPPAGAPGAPQPPQAARAHQRGQQPAAAPGEQLQPPGQAAHPGEQGFPPGNFQADPQFQGGAPEPDDDFDEEE
jgi:hypothetical protein